MRLNTALIARNLARPPPWRRPDIQDHAVELHEPCPAEVRPGRRAVYPESALDRIRALSPWRGPKTECAPIKGFPIHRAATETLVLHGVVLAGAFLYQGAARMPDPALPRHHEEGTSGGNQDRRGFLRQRHAGQPAAGDDPAFGRPTPWRAGQAPCPSPGLSHPPGPACPADGPCPGRKADNVSRLLAEQLQGGALPHPAHPDVRQPFRRRPARHLPLPRQRRPIPPPRQRGGHGDLPAARGFDLLDPDRPAPGSRLAIAVEGGHPAHAIHTPADDGGLVAARPDEGGFSADPDEIRLMPGRLP